MKSKFLCVVLLPLFAASPAMAVSPSSNAPSPSSGAIGGSNVDNIAFSIVNNFAIVTVPTPTGNVTVPTALTHGTTPQSIAASVISQLRANGGALAGPAIMDIRAQVEKLAAAQLGDDTNRQ